MKFLRSFFNKVIIVAKFTYRLVLYGILMSLLFAYRAMRIFYKRYLKIYTPIILRFIQKKSRQLYRTAKPFVLLAVRGMYKRGKQLYRIAKPLVLHVGRLAWRFAHFSLIAFIALMKRFFTALSKRKYVKKTLRGIALWVHRFKETSTGQKFSSGDVFLRGLFKRHRLKLAALNTGVAMLIVVLAVGGTFSSFAATNTWTQTNWAGGVGTDTDTQFTSQTNIDFGTTGEVTATSNDWYDADWSYRKSITISSANVSGSNDLYNYPLYIETTDTDWRTTANGGFVEQSDGGDIVFADSTGTKIDHTLETYTDSTGELQAWVRVPVLSASSDTTIYIYYGNDAGGLDESDQTGNVFTAWDMDGVGDYVEVEQESSLELDGVDQYMQVADDATLDFDHDDAFSVSLWLEADVTNDGVKRVVNKRATATGWSLYDSNGTWRFILEGSSSSYRIIKSFGSVTTGVPQHIAISYDGSGTADGVNIYVDGVESSSTSTDTLSSDVSPGIVNNEPFTVGADSTPGNYFDGDIDHVILWNKEISQAEVAESLTLEDYTSHSAYGDIVSWYNFEDADISGTTVSDIVGSNDGELQNSATNGGVAMPQDLNFGDGTEDEAFSVSFWAKPQSGDAGFISKKNEYEFYTVGGDMYFALVDGSISKRLVFETSGGEFAELLDQWALYTLTYDGLGTTSSGKIYVNGVELSTSGGNSGGFSAMEIGGEPVTLGYVERVNRYLDGHMGESIFWDKELSSSEISNIFNNGQPRLEENESLAGNIISGWRARGSTTGTGNVADLVGDNDATLTGGLAAGDIVYSYPRTAPGGGGSVDFNGGDEYISVSDDDSLSFGDGASDDAFTVYTWVKPEQNASPAGYYLFNKTSEYRARTISSGVVRFELSDASASANIRVQTSLDLDDYIDEWVLLVFTYDGSGSQNGIEAWVNGVEDASTPSVTGTYTAMENTSNDVEIGKASSSYFDEQQSHFGIVNKQLTSSEILELYNDGAIRDITTTSFASDVVSHYNLDSNDDLATSNGINDQVGSNDGTAQNMDSSNYSALDFPNEQNSYGTANWNTTVDTNLANPNTFYTVATPTNSAELISASFDTGDADSFIGDISWTETVSGSDEVKFQIRTAPDNGGSPGTWSGWLGPTNSSDYYTTPAGSNTINSAHTDATDDQWVQYKMVMDFSALTGPTVEDVTVTYVANSAPDFNTDFPSTSAGGVSASQASSGGTVDISYSVRDVDSTTGSTTPGEITPSFEYSTDGGSSWTAISSVNMAAIDTNTKAVDESTYTTHTATWDAASTLSAYTTEAQIRVTADDGEGGNNTGTASSQNFILDTDSPTVDSLSVDASTSPASLSLSCSDDTSLQMQYGLQSDISDGSYGAYATSATLSGVEGGDTVYLQCRDAYGNESTIASAEIPATPANLFYQDISDTSQADYRLFIAWSVVAEPTPGFANYKIYRSTDGSNYSLLQTVTNRSTNFIIDDGLSTGTTYYYRLTTTDDDGNVSSYSDVVSDNPDAQGGSDLTAPSISNISESALTATGITIDWNTDELSNSTVYFEATDTDPGTTPGNYDSSQGVPTFTTDNEVSLANLSPGTEYYYLITSADPSSNTGIASASGSFTTNSGPVISNVSAAQVFNDQAVVTWDTGSAADTTIYYSENSDMSSATQLGSSDDVTEHSITLTSLTNGTKYYFYVESEDADGNVTTDKNIVEGEIRYYSFTTTSDAIAPVITNVSAALTGETGATIAWTTDEGATSQIEWGRTTSLGTLTTQTSIYTTQHAVTLTGLDNTTTYYYRVISEDRAANSATDNNSGNTYSFTTLAPTEVAFTTTVTSVVGGDDTASPAISAIEVVPVSAQAARISFKTNEVALAGVDYGAGDNLDQDAVINGSYNFDHVATLQGLLVGQTYSFQIAATDASGNRGTSTVRTFTHQAPLSTSSLALSEATRDALTTLAQAESLEEASALAQEAFAELEALGVSVGDGGEGLAGEFGIINPQITRAGAQEATLSWRTTRPARAAVEVVNLQTNEVLRYESISFFREHQFVLDNLEAQTSYTARITAEDAEGTTVTSPLLPFSTSVDTRPLEVFDLQTSSTLIPERAGAVQVLISWKTNKPATSQVLYAENTDDELREQTIENQAYVTDHVVVMPQFRPGIIYRIQALSRDRELNEVYSQKYSLLTPRSRENIVDVIVENVQDTFQVFRR
jgi:hypothetical protein